MSDQLPRIYLARHGETTWSLSGQHTGLTDLPLTARGEKNSANLGKLLQGVPFERVLVSPLQRAMRTCELAGFLPRAEVDPLLVEWNYGDYEGRTTADIQRERPDWEIFRDGCPAGESVADVSARADRVVAHLLAAPAPLPNRSPPNAPDRSPDAPLATLVFSSAHFMRVLAARWLGLDARFGRLLTLNTASLSILGCAHTLDEPMIQRWNDDSAARM